MIDRASNPTAISVWGETSHVPTIHPLNEDGTAEICVVGAGMAGLSIAYQLCVEGKNVIVVDAGPIGGGQTKNTTAQLSNVLDRPYLEIAQRRSVENARLAAESHTAAINSIQATIEAEQIKCDFTRLDGYLFQPADDPSEKLDAEYAAMKQTGVLEVQRISRAPLESFDTGPCIRIANQGQFHPLKYLVGLADAIRRRGGRIRTGTRVSHVKGGANAYVETDMGHRISANHIVVATNSPINDLLTIHTKQAPYMTYVIGARVPAGMSPRGLFWDTADPYHYVRSQIDSENSAAGDLLLIGGEDHKTGQADDGDERFSRLEAWARARFPYIQAVTHRWCGQIMESLDGLAFIGRNPLDEKNVYLVTGDSGLGMTHGTIAGILITDLIQGRENPWTELYEPARKPFSAVGTYIKENANVALQYGTWVTPGQVGSIDEVLPGHGAVLRRGLSKVAVYRHEDGALTELSAVCPHLQCVVAWNSVDHTWDCPCHGSRFNCQGKVLSGPTTLDLPSVF